MLQKYEKPQDFTKHFHKILYLQNLFIGFIT